MLQAYFLSSVFHSHNCYITLVLTYENLKKKKISTIAPNLDLEPSRVNLNHGWQYSQTQSTCGFPYSTRPGEMTGTPILKAMH